MIFSLISFALSFKVESLKGVFVGHRGCVVDLLYLLVLCLKAVVSFGNIFRSVIRQLRGGVSESVLRDRHFDRISVFGKSIHRGVIGAYFFGEYRSSVRGNVSLFIAYRTAVHTVVDILPIARAILSVDR